MAATLPIIDLNAWDPEDVEQSLKTIVDALERVTSAKVKFMRYFLRWSRTRMKSITSLDELSDELDKHKKNTDISKIVGASVGIVAGVAGVTGCVLLTIATAGLAPVIAASAAPAIVATGGTVVGTLGGLTAGGSFIAEKVIDATKLREAETILNMDEAHFEPLKEFIIEIIDLKEAVQKIMEFDVFVKLMGLFSGEKGARQNENFNKNNTTFPSEFSDIVNKMPLSSDMKIKLKNFLSFIFSSANQELKKIFSFIIGQMKTLFFDQGIARAFCLIGIGLPESSSSVENLFTFFARAGTGAGRLVAPIVGGILNAVAVAIDIVILVKAANSTAKGSKSELGAEISKIAADMLKELKIMQKIYRKLST